MMKKILFFTFLILFTGSTVLLSQNRKNPYKRRGQQSFLNTQWWLGFHAGGNFTKANSDESFSTFAPVNYEQSLTEKQYGKMLPGGQAGLTIAFFHRGFSFIVEPTFRTQQFDYTNNYHWVSEQNPENTLDLQYTHRQNLQYVDLPVYLRYDLLKGKFRPYVQFGGYYSRLLNAKKTVETEGTDLTTGSAGNFQDQTITLGSTDLFEKSNYGIAGGAGVSYDVWNVRFVLGVNYRHGLANITNEANRYASNPVADTGDVLDNMTLQSVDISLNCVFPLRFISKDLKSVE